MEKDTRNKAQPDYYICGERYQKQSTTELLYLWRKIPETKHNLITTTVEKDTRNKAQPNYCKRDYTKWQDQNFLDDLSIQKWGNDLQDMKEIYDNFTWRFKSCVNRQK